MGGYRISREKLDIHGIYPAGLAQRLIEESVRDMMNVEGRVSVFLSVIAPSGDEVF